MTHIENNITNLQIILDNIRSIAANNNLKYRLDFLYEDDLGARIRLAYVKPDNENHYSRILATGRGFASDIESVLEEELLLEIKNDTSQWIVTHTHTIEPDVFNKDQTSINQAIQLIKDVVQAETNPSLQP